MCVQHTTPKVPWILAKLILQLFKLNIKVGKLLDFWYTFQLKNVDTLHFLKYNNGSNKKITKRSWTIPCCYPITEMGFRFQFHIEHFDTKMMYTTTHIMDIFNSMHSNDAGIFVFLTFVLCMFVFVITTIFYAQAHAMLLWSVEQTIFCWFL